MSFHRRNQGAIDGIVNSIAEVDQTGCKYSPFVHHWIPEAWNDGSATGTDWRVRRTCFELIRCCLSLISSLEFLVSCCAIGWFSCAALVFSETIVRQLQRVKLFDGRSSLVRSDRLGWHSDWFMGDQA